MRACKVRSCNLRSATAKAASVCNGVLHWFDGFLKELTDEFGGATSFLPAPGHGEHDGEARTLFQDRRLS
jgi:hypothetical protein